MKLSFDVLTRYALNFSMSPTRVTDMLSAARAVDAWNTSLRKFHRLPVSYKVRCVIIVALFLTYTVDYLIMHMVGLAAKLCSFAVMQD